MKSKTPHIDFSDPELQKTYDDFRVSQSDPKNIALWNEQLKENQKSYWTSLPFIITLASLLPLAFLIWLVQQPGFSFDPVAFIVPILLPIGAFRVSWPRRRW